MANREHVISWDWKEQPDLRALAHAILEVSGGAVHLTEVRDTGMDQIAVVITTLPLTQREAGAAFHRHLREEG